MVQPVRIAASIRLILAMFRLCAGIEEGFGRALINIIQKSFPDQKITISPSAVGGKLMGIARKQLQYNDTDAVDAVQDLLTYLSVGSKYETDAKGKVQYDADGEPVPRAKAKMWDFSKDFDTWNKALDAVYSNLRTTAITRSKVKTKRKKKERSIDQAYGVREEGGAPEGGEARMPTPEENPLGMALDTKSAVREFINLIDKHVPRLREFLTEDARKLFDLIYDDEVGSFGSDIQENMGQATLFKEKHPELYEKNAKRWSGYVGDLRKDLSKQIWEYIQDNMTNRDFKRLSDEFFSDISPSVLEKKKLEKEQGKLDYQHGIDLRKILRLRDKEKAEGALNPKDQTTLDNLTKKLKAELKEKQQQVRKLPEKQKRDIPGTQFLFDINKALEAELEQEREKSGSPAPESAKSEGETQVSSLQITQSDMNW
jgi:hypothetical protein